ncbi:alpha/beta fold hydrolase [Aquabacterium sp.]|uniref:alpha/beta fold hydrolase n=1 Tax=Aquabacterium sp. TaxID=1872578 RepID=UPI0035B010FC
MDTPLPHQPLLLSQLIGLIYETAADLSLWPRLLEQMASYLNQATSAPSPGSRPDLHQIVTGWFDGETPASLHGLPAEQSLLACLAPHFQRAHDIHLQLSEAETERNALECVMDRLPLGMAIVDANGSIISMNRSLLSITRGRNALKIDAGRLASTPTAALEHALQQVLSSRSGQTCDVPLRLPGAEPGTTLSLWVSKLAASAPSTRHHAPRALVLAASQTSRALSEAGLSALFGLTPAEARLTQQLALGQSVEEVCKAQGVSTNTAKTHLKRVFSKVGVKRQAELMQAVYSSPLWLDHTPHPPGTAAQTSLLAPPASQHDALSITLDHGRRLFYSDSGPSDGLPVILMHGIAGSRHLRHPDDALLLAQGIRLIIPERPGSGDSDPLHERRITDWPRDVIALADHLGIERFAVLGYSAGTPYAMATALARPDRVLAQSLVAAMPPIDRMEDVRDYSPTFRMSMLVAKFAPSLLPPLIRVMVKSISKNVYRFIEQSLSAATDLDRRVFEDPRLRASYANGLLAGVKRGVQDMVLEVLLTSHDWGLAPAAITTPTHFWHGEADKLVSLNGARKLASQVPHATFEVLPGGGHYIIYSHWHDILTRLRRAMQATAPA